MLMVEIDVGGHVAIEDLSADGLFLIGNLEHLDVLTHVIILIFAHNNFACAIPSAHIKKR